MFNELVKKNVHDLDPDQNHKDPKHGLVPW